MLNNTRLVQYTFFFAEITDRCSNLSIKNDKKISPETRKLISLEASRLISRPFLEEENNKGLLIAYNDAGCAYRRKKIQ